MKKRLADKSLLFLSSSDTFEQNDKKFCQVQLWQDQWPHGADSCVEDLSCLPDGIDEVCPKNISDFPQFYQTKPIYFHARTNAQANVEYFEWNEFHYWHTTTALFKGTQYFFGGESPFLDLDNPDTVNGTTYTRWNRNVFHLDGKSFKETKIKLPNDGREFSRGTAATHFGEVWERLQIF